MRSYFISFKNATSKTEINIWKSKYTNTIKAKIVYDILTTLILKSKNNAINKLKGYYDYTLRIDLFQEKYENYEKMQLLSAFDTLKWSSQRNLVSILDKL